MPDYTQENRLIAIDTPLGEDVLLLREFTGHEGISRLFSFNLDLLSQHKSIAFKDIVGQRVSIRISLGDTGDRYFNGFVSRFAQSGTDAKFTHFQMEVVPWFWFLTRIADCRIFQNKSIPDIIQNIFRDGGFHDFRESLQGTYEPREYCVQYRETDFNFVSRLMEQYGIFYYFEHTKDKHTLVLSDSSPTLVPCPIQSDVRYTHSSGGLDSEDVITAWQIEQELRSGKYSLRDYNFETPAVDLLSTETTVFEVADNTQFEIYDYPGDYLTPSDGTKLAKLRMQEEEAGHLVASGSSVCRTLASGYIFKLEDHDRSDLNAKYLLTEVQHVASVGESYGHEGGGAHYSNHFTCIQSSVPFRPPRVTPKPLVQGPQTAKVVGASGNEIYVDKFGRVKVQFYWDRKGQKDANSSCWIRVSQPWAGKGWGAMWIPRIGQEVIVSFLEGDPDRPIITGRIYNADQTVPYILPDNDTVSTFQSRTSKNGGAANYNEIRFQDKKDSEQIFINAEKDMDVIVEKDSREKVGDNRSLIVTNDQKESVGGDLHIQVTGNTNEKIGQTLSTQVGENLYEKSGQNYAHQAGMNIYLKAGMSVVIEGLDVTLKAGGNFVNVGPAGVAISGSIVLINSGGAAGSGSPPDTTDPQKPDTASSSTG